MLAVVLDACAGVVDFMVAVVAVESVVGLEMVLAALEIVAVVSIVAGLVVCAVCGNFTTFVLTTLT